MLDKMLEMMPPWPTGALPGAMLVAAIRPLRAIATIAGATAAVARRTVRDPTVLRRGRFSTVAATYRVGVVIVLVLGSLALAPVQRVWGWAAALGSGHTMPTCSSASQGPRSSTPKAAFSE